jgi:hypothetical protein
LFARIFLPIRLDLFNPLFNLGDSKRDLFLLLLQLFQCDDLTAQLRKIRRLCGAFAAEIYFAFLQQTFFVTQRQARSLASDFQRDLTKPCADETHGKMLRESALAQTQNLYPNQGRRSPQWFTLRIRLVLPAR